MTNHHTQHVDHTGVHGMAIIVCTRSSGVYLSHLPMFRVPHDFQVILAASLIKRFFL